ncbi:MAG: hypothetical protein H6Q55_702 [Deltaproteobacteria bacterium]|jgi:hypothetical protein|nr:hypothetical protein [Deltaproteobacteria bacterium]
MWAVGTRLVNATFLPEEKPKGFEARLGLDATKPIGAPPDQYKRVRTRKPAG